MPLAPADGNHRSPADRRDGGTDGLDPAGVFVSHYVGKGDVHFFAPQSFDDVQVGAADAGAADTHDNIGGLFDGGIGDRFVADELLLLQRRVIGMEYCRFHG